MTIDSTIFLPATALLLGVLLSAIFFIEWLRHQKFSRRFLLYWALGLFFMYWFQVPAILAKAGKVITVTDFNLFFTLSFPITLLALIFFYLGILDILKIRMSQWAKVVFWIWFSSAFLFFGYHFIIQGGIISTYSLPLAGNIIFYLPIRTLIILTLARWFLTVPRLTLWGVLGAVGIAGESVLGLLRNFLIIKNVLIYPPSMWYRVLSDLQIFFILQSLSVIVLVFGFYFFYRMYLDPVRNSPVTKKNGMPAFL